MRPTRRLAFGVSAALGGLVLLYFLVAVVSRFDWDWLYSDEFQAIGAAVSGLAVIVAALSLTLDFARVDQGSPPARRSSWSGTPPMG